MHKSTELRKLIVSTNGRVSVVPRVYETSMTDRENRESTSDHSIADKTTGRPSNSRRESQTNRLTIESVRETIGTRQASLLERRTLPQIMKQVERKLISLLCFARYKYGYIIMSFHTSTRSIVTIIIIIVYYAEAARHTDNRYYNTTHRKHKSCKHKT